MSYGHHNGYPPPFGPPQVGHIGNTLGLHRYGNMQEFCIDSAPSSPPLPLPTLPVLPSPIHQQPFNYNPLPMPVQMPIQSKPNDFPFEDDDEPDYSTEFDYDSDIDDNSNSMPQRTHSNPQFYRQSSDDERRYTRSKMPPCGISARFLRTNDSSSFTYNTIGSSSLELSTDTNEENLGGMYASIDKERRYRERLRSPILAPIPNRDLSMIEEISPVRNCTSPSSDDGYSGPPVPSPRFPKHWNPQLTSTSTSLKPIQPLLPKTNPYQEYNMRSANIVSSTPKTSERRRIPKFSSNAPQYQKNFERPRSYYADVDDDLNYMEPPTNTLSSVRSWTTEFKPEAYGLPSGVAKYFGVTGILFLTISYCTATRRIEVTVKNAVFFRDASQTQVCSYVRIDLHHRSQSSHSRHRHGSSSRKRHSSPDRYNASRVEQSHRTKLAYTTNKPEYKERFVFPISHDCRKDSLLVNVYAMNADNVQTQRLMGCMAFPLERMFKKLKNLDVDYYYRDGPENAPKFELYSDGFFILSRERGLKNHLGSKKINKRTYYDVGCHSSCSSRSSPKMLSEASSRVSSTVPFGTSNGMKIYSNPHHQMDYTSASSSNASNDYRHSMKYAHRATLPNITTTTSDNTSDADGMSDSPRERRRDRHHLCPDSGSNTNRYSVNDEQFDKMPSGGGFVRRAASFTYSPKGTLDKNNQRPAQLQEKEQTKKGFFGPISKTLSYLRNKMDTALSTSQLYPTKDEVRQWETSFEALLNNKQGCALFRQFLKKEFSDENVDFWCACEEFKNIKDPKKLKQKAHEIYKEFVAEQAPKEVNLDSDTRAATKAAIFEEVVKLDTFSLAQSRIEQLMAKDSYRRFLKDRIYLDMLEGFENGTNSNTGSTANLANGNNSPK